MQTSTFVDTIVCNTGGNAASKTECICVNFYGVLLLCVL
jgi:hypothetical protein